MAGPHTPDIRGAQREELVQDLARGELTYEQLAEKNDQRHVNSIKQFAARNRAEIQVVRAGQNKLLHERLAEIPIADQARRIAVNQLVRDDLLAQLDDDGLSIVDRNRLSKTITAINRSVAEEMGDLKARLDLTVQKNVLTDFDEIVLDDDGQFHAVAGTRHEEPDEPDGP